MVKQVKARRVAARTHAGFGRRELLLAGLGAVSLTRKQGIALYGRLVSEGRTLQARARGSVDAFGKRVDGNVRRVRGRVLGAIAPLQSRAQAGLQRLRGDVMSRLQPLLSRLGVTAAAPRRAPAKAVRRPAAKRSVRKSARRAA